jgi:Short C-terminal domain
MALLSQLIRTAAITGDPGRINAWFADRQGKRWAEQTVRAAFPPRTPGAAARPAADPAERLRTLTELHERGVVTDAEFERLRARLGV